MARFTISQLDVKPSTYSILETDLLLMSTGTDTPFLSSVKVSTLQLGSYFASISAGWKHGDTAGEIYHTAGNVGIGLTDPTVSLTVAGDVSVSGDISTSSSLSAVQVVHIHNLPTSDPNIKGQLYHTSGTAKISL